jgi:hypothetical protein
MEKVSAFKYLGSIKSIVDMNTGLEKILGIIINLMDILTVILGNI